jgi:hypothetical protein
VKTSDELISTGGGGGRNEKGVVVRAGVNGE